MALYSQGKSEHVTFLMCLRELKTQAIVFCWESSQDILGTISIPKIKHMFMKLNTVITTLHISLHLILIKILECRFYC